MGDVCGNSSINTLELKIAHIHGGEKTLGFDNITEIKFHLLQRYTLTHQKFSDRVIELINSNKLVFNVGSLSISNMKMSAFLIGKL